MTVSDQKTKPVLDEQALERLLEAAFVLQEHNLEQQTFDRNLELQSEQLRAQDTAPGPAVPATNKEKDPATGGEDYTLTLAQIVETQRQIQVRQLNLDDAMALVAERIVRITEAAGSAIAILDGKKIRYRAVSGSCTLPLGTEVATEKAVCAACLRVGQVIRCHDINTEFLFDVEECRGRGIQSVIAVPIYHDGDISGGLELFFTSANAFSEQDVHSCQLMAGLVTEAFARNDEVALKKSLAAERATMLEALEKLKPNLAALLEKPSATKPEDVGSVPDAETSPSRKYVCKCGHELVAEEQFCGNCGSPRSASDEPKSMQSKVASMWQMQQAQNSPDTAASSSKAVSVPDLSGSASPEPELLDEDLLASLQAESHASVQDVPQESPDDLIRQLMESEPLADNHGESLHAPVQKSQEVTAEAELENEPADAALEAKSAHAEAEEDESQESETALIRTHDEITWSSAAKAKDFLEQLAPEKNKSAFAQFWNARRGDIYLAVAVILVAVVIRWGIWSSHSVSATGGPNATATHRRVAPDADISMLDRMLISLGLADPPEAPENHGNPDTQVWVDLHTALYYCPGTDLYGKTPKGKYTSQRDAQLDQFEPAYRKACD